MTSSWPSIRNAWRRRFRSQGRREYRIVSDFVKLEADIPACCRLARTVPELNAEHHLRNLPEKPENTRHGERARHRWALRVPDKGDRPVLQRWPEMAAYLASFPGECIYAQVARMVPSARLGIHRDGVDMVGNVQEHYDLFNGTLRFHLPLRTSDNVHVFSDGKLYNMRVGEVWMLNNMKPHAVINDDPSIDRFHLVFDIVPSAATLELIRGADASLGSADRNLIARFWPEYEAA